MINLPKTKLAEWTKDVKESEIRRLLRHQLKYYFAGGLPGAIPVTIMTNIIENIIIQIREEGLDFSANSLFNYGSTEGTPKLREILATRMNKRENIPNIKANDVTISTGSQQALYGILRTVINPGDYILVPEPTYIGFLGPAEVCGANLLVLPCDEDGIIPESIELACDLLYEKYRVVPKLLYVQPDFENPSGLSLTNKRKKEIFDLACQWNFYIVEDTPYKEISFNQPVTTAIKSHDVDNNRVMYLRSSSKETASIRIGYSVLPPEIRNKFITLKGYIDLNTSNFTQEIAYRYYSNHIDSTIPKIVEQYRNHANAMKQAIDEFLPGDRTDPQGGFFIWHTFDKNMNMTEFLKTAMKSDIIYVPGEAFIPSKGYKVNLEENSMNKISAHDITTNAIRLSYSNLSSNVISEGIERLGTLIAKNY